MKVINLKVLATIILIVIVAILSSHEDPFLQVSPLPLPIRHSVSVSMSFISAVSFGFCSL